MELKNKEFREHESGLFVASDGEIFVPRNGTKKEHFTFGSDSTGGYKQVCRNKKFYLVHRLVAECFLDNPDSLPTVDHIDRDRTNNNVSNLRWADMSLQGYNRENHIRQNYPNNRKGSKKVLQLTLDGELVREWPSANECHRNGFKTSAVSRCCNGKLPHYKKSIWRYK